MEVEETTNKEQKPEKPGPVGTSSVGGATTEFSAKNAVLTVNSILMAAGKNWSFDWGYKADREYVTGTPIPRVLHQGFEGDVECECIYVSNDNWFALAGNQDTVYSVESVDTDTQATPQSKTIIATIKITKVSRKGPANADGVVKASLKGMMTAFPTGGF
jgi:hypothetical protein